MTRPIGIGNQDFEKIRTNHYFYIDKTKFIREWWEAADEVTLITRPRRFGKTLNMNMLEKFFSVSFKDRGDLFQGLDIWEDEKFRKMQGTYPVIFLSFADVKETTFQGARQKICKILQMSYNKFDFLLEEEILNENEKRDFQKVSTDMESYMASLSLKMLSDFFYAPFYQYGDALWDGNHPALSYHILYSLCDFERHAPDEAVESAYIRSRPGSRRRSYIWIFQGGFP